MTDKPNILCFITDQQRADHLACYGNPDVKTPNIDALARDGVQFTRSFVTNPVCMPNRSSIFTGLTPQAHGVRENGMGLNPDIPVLADLLRQHGYRTASIGKLHLNPYDYPISPDDPRYKHHETLESRQTWQENTKLPTPYYGFETTYFTGGHGATIFGEYQHEVGNDVHAQLNINHAACTPSGAKDSWKSSIDVNNHYSTKIAQHTINYLQDAQDHPFFVWCSLPDPHHPYMPPAPYANHHNPADIHFNPKRRNGELELLPDYVARSREGRLTVGGLEGGSVITDAEHREILAHTYGMIELVDEQIGRVIQHLKDTNQYDNTIIVFMSDHGDMMGDHWLINKGPFPFEGLLRVPTIWRLPQPMQGKQGTTDSFISSMDFMPTVLEFAGVTVPGHVQGRSYKGVLTGEVDAVRDSAYVAYDESYIHDRLRHLRTDDWAITCHAYRPDGYLFDLKNDPDELHNLWDDPAYAQQKQALMAQLAIENMRADSWLPTRRSHA